MKEGNGFSVMAISVVNGYLCMNGCDAAKARTGQNPHANAATADNATRSLGNVATSAGASGDIATSSSADPVTAASRINIVA